RPFPSHFQTGSARRTRWDTTQIGQLCKPSFNKYPKISVHYTKQPANHALGWRFPKQNCFSAEQSLQKLPKNIFHFFIESPAMAHIA
ncbi:hypothetical protein, partial [Sphaerochaeta sp. PS]|uniref:hypothetical protein n=1 Tax=Sphaerochaeta sp. PS TaxID=3076336 RepID=UPI0028A4328E